MILEYVLYLIGFCIFCLIQSFIINGIYESSREGMILYPIRMLLKKYISDYFMKPVFECIKCMSSVWGGITFWSFVIPVFGFNFYEIWIFLMNVFVLVSLNYFIYKNI